MAKHTPTVTVLVGVPASGKSTWRELSAGDAFVYSTDDVVEELAAVQGKTYEQVWSDQIKHATKIANECLAPAIKERKNVISDRTNLTAESRRKFLTQFPKSYVRKAVLFAVPPADVLKARIAGRPGKNIPAEVLSRMIKDLEEPTLDEGFASVKFIDYTAVPVKKD